MILWSIVSFTINGKYFCSSSFQKNNNHIQLFNPFESISGPFLTCRTFHPMVPLPELGYGIEASVGEQGSDGADQELDLYSHRHGGQVHQEGLVPAQASGSTAGSRQLLDAAPERGGR
jgi:hypothetical protein